MAFAGSFVKIGGSVVIARDAAARLPVRVLRLTSRLTQIRYWSSVEGISTFVSPDSKLYRVT